jgi:hypothetical protein
LILLLLDADVVIDLHRFGIWDRITKAHQVYIPSIILHREAYYYVDTSGRQYPICLNDQIGKTIQEIACSAEELLSFSENFDSAFQTEIHDGEKEALILLSKEERFRFCTCDKSAIKSLALLGLTDRGISFERLMKASGLASRELEYKQTEDYFRRWAREGSIMKIQGRGIKQVKSKKRKSHRN